MTRGRALGLTLALVMSFAGLCLAEAPAPECSCTTAKQTNGWCEAHSAGYVGSVRITSRMLYETLDAHGHELDLSTFECGSCKKAIVSDGFCEEHRVGFVGRLAYFSRLTYELARGDPIDPAGISCPDCRNNSQTHGWCDKCRLGMIGVVAIKDRLAYEQAAKAVNILRAAIDTAPRCERCAVAIVTDTQCSRCRITYKDGVPLPAPPKP